MALPILAKPVTRPHFVDPTTCVDLEHGEFEHVARVWVELSKTSSFSSVVGKTLWIPRGYGKFFLTLFTLQNRLALFGDTRATRHFRQS